MVLKLGRCMEEMVDVFIGIAGGYADMVGV